MGNYNCRASGGDLYDAPAALLMHGKEADPVFCYAWIRETSAQGKSLTGLVASLCAIGRELVDKKTT
jgi:hypothetical protein